MKKHHQHFIPRTYLKNFHSSRQRDKYFVDALDLTENTPIQKISIADICVEKDLYTLSKNNKKGEYALENYLSKKIEDIYPSVYKLLVIDKKEIITPEERIAILHTTLSLYFRTPKILNMYTKSVAELVENIRESDIREFDIFGYQINTDNKTFNEIRKEIRSFHRENFMKIQLSILHDFMMHRLIDGLYVNELVGDNEYLTCDNPVKIGHFSQSSFDLFDSKNSIYIPLDARHALYFPPKQEETIINKVLYGRDNFVEHYYTNLNTFKNAERWLIGTKLNIERFLAENKLMSENSPYTQFIVDKQKSKLDLMMHIVPLVEKGISNDNVELVSVLKILPQLKMYEENVEIRDLYSDMKAAGLNI
jgi:hypothetical protein